MPTTMITEEELREAENRLVTAQLAGDVVALDQLLYNDLIAMSPTGQSVNKEMDLDAYRSGAVVIEEASATIEDIRIFGETAVCIVSMKAKGTMMGNPLEGQFRYFRVWKRFDDALKLVGASYMQIS